MTDAGPQSGPLLREVVGVCGSAMARYSGHDGAGLRPHSGANSGSPNPTSQSAGKEPYIPLPPWTSSRVCDAMVAISGRATLMILRTSSR